MIKLILSLLVAMVFFSSLQIIVIRQQNRLRMLELQTLQQRRDVLRVEWQRLQLEQHTWTQPSRIETIAREQLNMISPAPQNIIVIEP
jgi:cell division protein FtsL